MPDLFRLVKDSPAEPVEEVPFASESEFEGFVFDNPQLLGEGIKIIDRQVVCDAGRMDILALDESRGRNRVVIVELKNVPADIKVLLQTLRYANWAITNQDSVRVLLQNKKIPHDKIEFDPIRVIVAAPEIEDALLDLSQHIKETFVFDFIELRRFKRNGERFVIVTRPGSDDDLTRETESIEDWGWNQYRDRLGWTNDLVDLGQALFRGIEKKIQSKDWDLESGFVKNYIAFYLGRQRVVGLNRKDKDSFYVFFMRSPMTGPSVRVPEDLEIIEHPQHKTDALIVKDPNFDFDRLDSLFEASYAIVTGTAK